MTTLREWVAEYEKAQTVLCQRCGLPRRAHFIASANFMAGQSGGSIYICPNVIFQPVEDAQAQYDAAASEEA